MCWFVTKMYIYDIIIFQKTVKMAELTANISSAIAKYLPEGGQLISTVGHIGKTFGMKPYLKCL